MMEGKMSWWQTTMALHLSTGKKGPFMERWHQTALVYGDDWPHMPQDEPLMASHLHLSQQSMTSTVPTFPAKTDRFQTLMTEKVYKLVATAVLACNASSMLDTYQAELRDEIVISKLRQRYGIKSASSRILV